LRRFRTATLMSLVTVMLAGCAAAPTPLSVSASPEEVARRYYELLAAGDDASARSLTWRPARFDGVVPDRSLRGLTDLQVDRSREDTVAGRPVEYLELAELRMLVVRYARHKGSVTGDPPGHDMRFVLLGRQQRDGRWLVVETGTGP
jgi:hypothetical protein